MLVGKGISEGIGLGKAVILEENRLKIEKQKIENISAEKQKIYDAVKEVESEIEKLIKNIDGTEKEIMQAYLMILQDPSLIQETIKIIEQEKCNSAYAVENGLNQIIKTFEEMDDPYMAARSRDIEDMKKRILAKLLKIEEIDLSKLPENTILVAKELSTSDSAKMNLKNISGIITEIGGVNSHMAIIARTNEIPAIVGIRHIFENIKENDFIALNGATGEIFLNPTQEKIEELTKNQENIKQEKQELEKYKNKKAITKDGHQVELLANIGGPQDIQIVIDNTAEGVGLLRSEFLYMDAKDFPSEEEQFEAYKKIAESLENKRLVIRTLDIGGDKDLKYMKLPKEENPFLGYRAIRIYLDNVDLFKVQLRAILRASSYGNVAIMLPMISSIEELRKSKEIIEEVKQIAKDGYVEVTLLGQNVNAYGKDFTDRNYTFANLLEDLHQTEIKRIRFTTSHPRDLDDATIHAMALGGNIMPHLHLPVQSGNNEVLKRMNRKYTKEDYLEKIKKLKDAVPGISITTDIIVAFPGETEEQFLDTIDLVKKVEYDGAYTFIYSPREGTPASTYDNPLTEEQKHQRLNALNEVINAYSLKGHQRFENQIVEVLVEGPSKNNPDMLTGYTKHNMLVNFPNSPDHPCQVGDLVYVLVTKAFSWHLLGELKNKNT